MPKHHNILIAGGTGLIGTALTKQLREQGHSVYILTRGSAESARQTIHWQPDTELDLDALSKDLGKPITAVINLAGYSISKMPWTASRKHQILSSRVEATRTLAQAIAHAKNKPEVFVSGSAVGIYGNRGNTVLTEKSSAGNDFLAEVTMQWEAATAAAQKHTRLVFIRTGLVLAQKGALAPMKFLTKLFLAGPLGGGSQWWPWISLRDEVAAIIFLLTHKSITGPVNLVAPSPHTATEVMRALAQQLGRPFWLPAPSWAIKILLGSAGKELLLSSQKVSPEVLLKSGFTFQYSDISTAIAESLR